MQEEWKSATGYDGFYEVSNLGRIRSHRRYTRCVSKAGREFQKLQGGGLMKLVEHNGGYLSVVFSAEGVRKSFLAHRVVAEAFIPNPNNLPWINHKDANKRNNAVDNLEWCTAQENYQHAAMLGLLPPKFGSEKGTAKLNEEVVFVIKKMIKLGFTNKRLAEIFEVSTAPISYIRNNQAWTHVPW